MLLSDVEAITTCGSRSIITSRPSAGPSCGSTYFVPSDCLTAAPRADREDTSWFRETNRHGPGLSRRAGRRYNPRDDDSLRRRIAPSRVHRSLAAARDAGLRAPLPPESGHVPLREARCPPRAWRPSGLDVRARAAAPADRRDLRRTG